MYKWYAWFDLELFVPIILVAGLSWRSWLPRVFGVRNREEEAAVLESPPPEVEQLREMVGKLRRVNQQQQQQILYLQEINQRLQLKSQLVDDFVHRGALRQHEEKQQQALEGLGCITQDLEPILDGIEECQGPKGDLDQIKNLRDRSRNIEAQIQKMKGNLAKQKEELLEKLQEKELSLRMQESDLEGIHAINRKLQEEVRKVRLENSRLAEEVREKEQLRKAWQKAENDLQVFKKQLQVVASARERLESAQGLAQENTLLKKTVAQLEGKLRIATQQMKLLKMEYEKLMEEYERIFSQI
jgi:DNA repair exonuclease SbcCD ATPase subunit